MQKTAHYITCSNCGKQHKADSVKVKYNPETLEWNCIKCNLVTVVFTKSELKRMLDLMEKTGNTGMIYNGHVRENQYIIARNTGR